MKQIAILGATGSIGASALDVIGRHPDRFRVSVLSANSRVDQLAALCRQHHPRRAIIADASRLSELRQALAGTDCIADAGAEALEAAAGSDECDTVIAAIVGVAGLRSTLAAARSGKRLLLANKEAIVVAGNLLMQAVADSGALLLPIDSEHNAIFQCLPAQAKADAGHGVERVVLTASGGPFRGWSRERLASVTPEQACAHPNWDMGQKISVDSATLMNKGLEVIEAHWLFGAAAADIEVVVHPQSIIHSLVGYRDGSMLAQLGQPDMRTALAYGLSWPERIDAGVSALDLVGIARLEFETVDRGAFPCLDLAYQALKAGGGASTVLNAANEIAVSAFLQRQLGFLSIPAVIADTLAAGIDGASDELTALLALDASARKEASRQVKRHTDRSA